jgi:hypothetical protein
MAGVVDSELYRKGYQAAAFLQADSRQAAPFQLLHSHFQGSISQDIKGTSQRDGCSEFCIYIYRFGIDSSNNC